MLGPIGFHEMRSGGLGIRSLRIGRWFKIQFMMKVQIQGLGICVAMLGNYDSGQAT